MTTSMLTVSLMLLMSCYLPTSKAESSEVQSDRAHRDPAMHWPAAYDPSAAPVFSHNELLIRADCHRAFAYLTDAADWPNWLVIVRDVVSETTGNTGQGALYRLQIFNSHIQSRIVEFAPDQRISWVPFGADETESRHGHYHAWHFVPKAKDCLVITEETGIGLGDQRAPAVGSHLMHKAHELWLDSLRYVSEP